MDDPLAEDGKLFLIIGISGLCSLMATRSFLINGGNDSGSSTKDLCDDTSWATVAIAGTLG